MNNNASMNRLTQSRNNREGHYVGCTQGIHVRERCNASSVYWHKHRDGRAAYQTTLDRLNILWEIVDEMSHMYNTQVLA